MTQKSMPKKMIALFINCRSSLENYSSISQAKYPPKIWRRASNGWMRKYLFSKIFNNSIECYLKLWRNRSSKSVSKSTIRRCRRKTVQNLKIKSLTNWLSRTCMREPCNFILNAIIAAILPLDHRLFSSSSSPLKMYMKRFTMDRHNWLSKDISNPKNLTRTTGTNAAIACKKWLLREELNSWKCRNSLT